MMTTRSISGELVKRIVAMRSRSQCPASLVATPTKARWDNALHLPFVIWQMAFLAPGRETILKTK